MSGTGQGIEKLSWVREDREGGRGRDQVKSVN